jgi:hypothetical protein
MESTKNNILANLLAQERLRVEHRNVPTACFMLKERVLVLPFFAATLDESVYVLLVAHEVGHALYTPTEGWHDALTELPKTLSNKGRGFKSFLNVIEDARIERKIKYRYPGLRKEFFNGYTALHKNGFFGNHKSDELLLIDRINLYYKVGARLVITFTQKEKQFLAKIDAAQTWQDVVRISVELYEYCAQELKERIENEEEGGVRYTIDEDGDEDGDDLDFDYGDGDEDGRENGESDKEKKTKGQGSVADEYNENDLESLTDKSFREKEANLAERGSELKYALLPELDPRDYVVSIDKVLKHFIAKPTYRDPLTKVGRWWQELESRNLHREFLDRNNKYISYLVKEFELRKNASQLAKAKVSKTGDIDVNKLYSYKFNNEIFKSITIVPNGKNHGLLMLIDWSGSMDGQIGAVLEQVLCMVHFCRKVGIPHRVYAFLSYRLDETLSGEKSIFRPSIEDQYKDEGVSKVVIGDFSLATLFSDTMNRQQFAEMSKQCYRIVEGRRESKKEDSFGGGGALYVHCGMGMSGTPLNEAVILMRYIISQFKKQYKLDVVNAMVLTDGSGRTLRVTNSRFGPSYYGDHMVYVDPITGKEKRSKNFLNVKGRQIDETAQLRAIVELIREATGANMLGFFAANTAGDIAYMLQANDETSSFEKVKSQLKSEKFVCLQNLGYNEFYVLKAGELEIKNEDFANSTDKNLTKGKLLKAFLENQNKKQLNRIFLNRLIKQIA